MDTYPQIGPVAYPYPIPGTGTSPVLPASAITSGTIDTARLGSGTANAAKYLRGDQTWNGVAAADVTDRLTLDQLPEMNADTIWGRTSGTGSAGELDCTSLGRSIISQSSGSGVRGVIAAADQVTPQTATGNVLRCPCHVSTTQIAASGTIYWCYVGYRPYDEIIRYVRVGVSTAGAGTQTAEVAVATSTTGPNNAAALTLTKVWADGTLDDLTTTGVKGNATANTTPLGSDDAHVFVGVRFAMGTTQPTLHILQRDWGDGFLCQTSGASALTGSSSWTATPVTFANNTSADVRGYL